MNPSLLLGRDTHRDLTNLLLSKRHLVLSGASNETAKALLTSAILHHMEKMPTTLLVTGTESGSEALQHWLSFFECPNQPLGLTENEAGEITPVALQQFLLFMEGERKQVSVCPREVWETPFPLFSEMQERMIILKKGEKIDFTAFVEKIVSLGYSHGDDLYLRPGEYRRTGDVLDIFPVQEDNPYRIPFEFEKIEKILAVDAQDLSKTSERGKELRIFPIVYEKMALLLDQLQEDTLLILDDQDDTEGPAHASLLRFTAFPESQENHVHLRYLSVLKFYTLTDFLNDVRDKLAQGWMIFVVSKRLKELTAICGEEHIPYSTKDERRKGAITIKDASTNELLPHSLQNPDQKFALLTDREIFSLKKMGKERSIQKLALDFITSLTPGDYVVHMEHGIGHFEGMTQKEVDSTTREYLELTYAEGDRLFVPVDQADKLSKFVHEEGAEPSLTRLGTTEWRRVTEKMKKETRAIAKELLELYARRARAKGHAYDDDTKEQLAFDKAFPYQETPGQLKAIEDIKNDMEDDHPMDRLICGDVGFGKTEVAMRAAFKAVQGGKQVAILAPITILAHQHYVNFVERMEGFNVRIEMLSRFKKPAEQKRIIERLRKGDIDIVIGTHRLLQPDVKFHNLGLVILDEEQRFGVKQKETFKNMRASIDMLTLTATPIPRTLNLGLHKLRDITTITTPPPGRLPIITEVRKYSDALIHDAIVKEVKRGGQVYVLHNRVETIDAFADKLRELVPQASFIVGHGQLRPDELEKRIMDFKDGKHDVLVSSTIIENGIDLPRANTLIVNAAERFGLSQLYQLRGRVGRSKRQAYAYFLYHGQRLKDDAKKRLRAIVEACELGSGFQVAMRDLEIRGAGEILGAHQSGTMNTVGVSHYLRMLKTAVEELKTGSRGDIEEELSIEILLPVEAMIPAFYIPDEKEKISVYQKLAGSEDEAILGEFEEDLRQEYGEAPDAVQSLFAILRLKIACRRSHVVRVKLDSAAQALQNASQASKDEIVLTLHSSVTAKEIMQLVAKYPQWQISGSNLKIDYKEVGNGSDVAMLEKLTKQVEMLQKAKKNKKTDEKTDEKTA